MSRGTAFAARRRVACGDESRECARRSRDRPKCRGPVDSSDRTLDDDSYFDEWTFYGSAGTAVVITLASDDFDAYLDFGKYNDGTFESLEMDDDGSGDGTDAQIAYTLPASDTYATGYAANRFASSCARATSTRI